MILTKRISIIVYFIVVSRLLFCNNFEMDSIRNKNLSNQYVLLKDDNKVSFSKKEKNKSKWNSFKIGGELGISYQKDNLLNKKVSIFCDYIFKPTFVAGFGISN